MKYKLLLVIFIIGLIGSLLISLTPTSKICSPNEGCDAVLNSKYAETFGVRNSHYGIIIFTAISLITLFHLKNPSNKKRKIIHLAIIFGALIASYLIYLQYHTLNSYCKYCLVVDTSLIIGLLIVLLTWKH